MKDIDRRRHLHRLLHEAKAAGQDGLVLDSAALQKLVDTLNYKRWINGSSPHKLLGLFLAAEEARGWLTRTRDGQGVYTITDYSPSELHQRFTPRNPPPPSPRVLRRRVAEVLATQGELALAAEECLPAPVRIPEPRPAPDVVTLPPVVVQESKSSLQFAADAAHALKVAKAHAADKSLPAAARAYWAKRVQHWRDLMSRIDEEDLVASA